MASKNDFGDPTKNMAFTNDSEEDRKQMAANILASQFGDTKPRTVAPEALHIADAKDSGDEGVIADEKSRQIAGKTKVDSKYIQRKREKKEKWLLLHRQMRYPVLRSTRVHGFRWIT